MEYGKTKLRSDNYNFIQLLSDHVFNRSSSKTTVSQKLVSLGNSHQVIPIIYYQTKDKSLYQSYLQAVSNYTQRKTLLLQVEKALGDIPFYKVKGISVSQYYPVPQLRTMGDCDIIVHEEDKEKARKILLSIGFTDHTSEWDSAEWCFEKNGLHFDLHHRLLYDEIVNTEQEKVFTDTAWDYVKDHELDINFHFVFLLLHLKKHMLNRGVGIRQFMDLAMMSLNAELDRGKIKNYLKQAGIEGFASVCSALCQRWFGVAFPVETSEITDEFYNHATEKILENGVFGFEIQNYEEIRMLNKVENTGKLSLIIDNIFPSYKTCCIAPKYKWIKGKPYLLPALWSYRIFCALFRGKSKSTMEYMRAIAGSDKAMLERNKELSSWGL